MDARRCLNWKIKFCYYMEYVLINKMRQDFSNVLFSSTFDMISTIAHIQCTKAQSNHWSSLNLQQFIQNDIFNLTTFKTVFQHPRIMFSLFFVKYKINKSSRIQVMRIYNRGSCYVELIKYHKIYLNVVTSFKVYLNCMVDNNDFSYSLQLCNILPYKATLKNNKNFLHNTTFCEELLFMKNNSTIKENNNKQNKL